MAVLSQLRGGRGLRRAQVRTHPLQRGSFDRKREKLVLGLLLPSLEAKKTRAKHAAFP